MLLRAPRNALRAYPPRPQLLPVAGIPFVLYRPLLAVVLCALTVSVVIAADPAAENPPAVSTEHAERMAAGLALFKKDVRSVLVQQCVKCHGGKETESEFNLTTREGLLKGGTEGKAVEIGNAKASRLYKLITHSIEPEMPEDAAKLPDAQIAAIARWIDHGAPYDKPLIDKSADQKPWTERVVSEDAKKYWAFQPLGEFQPPEVKNKTWAQTEIDRFIAAHQEKRGVSPSGPASRRDLLRRAYFDLIGLPPTPNEIKQFDEESSRDAQAAFESLIDRLLESPHYGERWGRHWLDVVRFAESHGFEQDYDRPNAYHYRDFVIRALNMDLPYDQFVSWQLAGDEIAPDDPLAMMATGFMGAGVFPTQLTEKEFESARYDELADMTGTMGTAMLGMTIGCARCHDHKFDPIPQADFYRIASSFTTTIRSEIDLEIPGNTEGAPPIKTKVMVTSEGFRPIKHHADGRGFKHFLPETHFLKRGDANQKEGVAPQGFLQVLMRSPNKEKHWQIARPEGARTSHRRRALAAWVTDTQYGAGQQLARVIVNRLWQHHFGRGIVETPNDFGVQGLPPTYPKLLDWLANKLIENEWRLKPMHKLMMTTSVYMQESQFSETAAKTDPQNYLLWRYNPRRLEAEVIRDSMLAISGQLDRTMYGKGTLNEGMKRRSIYFFIKRSKLIPMMQLFDSPESLVSIGDRPATTIAPQALMFMNNPHVRSYARSFGEQLKAAADKSLEDAVRQGYMATVARQPTDEELADNVAFLNDQIKSYETNKQPNARDLALSDLCQVLMSLNEFIYVE
jgi:mono/diheme cytochrome c family protein